MNPAADKWSRVSGLRLKRAPVLLSAELVHDLWKVFTKHWAMIIKGQGVCVWRGGRTMKGRAIVNKDCGCVRGGRGGPVTPDLHPPGPFRAAQWLTPVSFQRWHYYYLHQSAGETERGQRCCEAKRTSLMPTTPISLSVSPPLLLSLQVPSSSSSRRFPVCQLRHL